MDPEAISIPFTAPDSFNLYPRIGAMNTPCLLVYGQNDPAITIPSYDPSTAPMNTHVITLDGAGHFPMLDDTASFSRLLTDFLALSSGESPRDLQLKEEWRRRVR